MRYGFAGKLTDEGYVPDAAVSQPEEWANPYSPTTGSPPLVAVPESSSFDWQGLFTGVTGGLRDIFGRPVQPPVVAVQQPGMPLWGWVAIGVGGVVVLGVLARSMRRAPTARTAGYRRRRRR